MRTDEVVVARLKGGIGLGRFLGDAPAVSGRRRQLRIATGRNREARLPEDRVIFATGVIATAEDDLERFRSQAEEIASALDLAEVWEVVSGEDEALSLDDVAELHWGDAPSGEQLAAMLLHLNRSALYFVGEDDGYRPRPQQAVEETLARQRRAAENELAREELAKHLAEGKLPPEPSAYQSELLLHLRGFAVHGENYTRNSVAEALMRSVDARARDLQRLSFETLVRVGVLAEDEPLELERADIRVDFAQEALDEAVALDVPAILRQAGRRDLTSALAVTIDDATTQDKDDALSLEVVSGDPAPVYRVGVHIADGGALIADGGAVDREADARMATLYLPELQVAMLPPSLSHRAGSLLPGEERAAVSLLADVTAEGRLAGLGSGPIGHTQPSGAALRGGGHGHCVRVTSVAQRAGTAERAGADAEGEAGARGGADAGPVGDARGRGRGRSGGRAGDAAVGGAGDGGGADDPGELAAGGVLPRPGVAGSLPLAEGA